MKSDTRPDQLIIVEGRVGIHEDLLALAANMFQLRQELSGISGWQGEQKAIAGPI
jgi:hypothetical protein